MHHARDNARRNNRLKGEVKRDLLVNNNDVRDKSVLWLVTEIYIIKINTFREDTISRTTKLNYKRVLTLILKLKRSCTVKWSSLGNWREWTDDILNDLSERGKRVPCQYVLRCLSERHLTSASDLFKAVNFCWSFLDFRRRRKLMVYFIRPRYYPTWHEIAGHFNIIKWTQWETDLCAFCSSQNVQNLSVQWSWSWIKHATGVGALSKTWSKGKLLISSLHSDDMDWYLQFLHINRSTWKKLRKLCFEIHVYRERSR